jgi:NADH-quinone oxidoreductase subunit J
MEIQLVLFYFWSILSGYSGWKVITTKNPISSVFWLVNVFINAGLLLLLLGIEFIPILFIVIYVGAIAILFLFVVFLLNIKLVELRENTSRYIPIASIIAGIFLWQILDLVPSSSESSWIQGGNYDFTNLFKLTNIQSLGVVLYTEYYFYFLVSSLILLVAMVGAIVLCLYHEKMVKRQDLFAQVATEYDKTVINTN